MITKLELENFRCFKKFVLEDIKPITLITGDNGTGKSTLLESIFLLIDRHNGMVFTKLNDFRATPRMQPLPATQWELLFLNKDTSRPILISIEHMKKKETLIISRDDTRPMNGFINLVNETKSLALSPINSRGYPIKLSYSSTSVTDETFHYILTDNGIQQMHVELLNRDERHVYYLKQGIAVDTVRMLTQVVDKSLLPKLIAALNILNPCIKDVSVALVSDVHDIHVDIGLPTRLSVKVLGDGINKLLDIILIMLAYPGSILLIDEVENGFHYSHMQDIWMVISQLAKDTICQVFATTHSYECLKNVVAVKDANPVLFDEMFALVTLASVGGRITCSTYGAEDFAFAIDNEMEVR